MTTVIGVGLLFILLLAVAVGGFLFLRRRAAAKSKSTKTQRKSKQTTSKKLLPKANKPAKRRQKPAQAQSVKPTTPASPNVTVESSAAAFPPTTTPSISTEPTTSTLKVEPIESSPAEKIRILIVDDNEGTRENVTRLLYFEDDLDVVGQAMNGRQGVEMAVELQPHIVLMDINMPDMDGITATQKMGVQVPFSQVVIMSVQSDQHYMKRAMAAGARDFQPKPFTSEELVSCLRRVYHIGLPLYQQIEAAKQTQLQQTTPSNKKSTQQDQTDARASVIAVYSPKGGVGTSAIATNLAIALQQEQGDVVLMDAALQFGDVLVHLNTTASRTIVDLIHENNLEVDLLPEILIPHTSGLKLLLGPTNPTLADIITSDILTEVITDLKNQCKVIVIDTDSQLTDENLTVLDNADYILVVTTPELPAVKDTKLFLEVAEQLEFTPDRLKVVINKANELGAVPPGKIKEVLSLKQAYYIPQDPRMEVALRNGLPVCQEDTSAPSAVSIVDMARRLWLQIDF